MERKTTNQIVAENRLSNSELLTIWDEEARNIEEVLVTMGSVDGIVDIVRRCNLRAKTAKFRDLKDYFAKWSLIKYYVLFRAIEMRANGVKGITGFF